MARIRSIKPEFRTSLTVTSWPRDVRLFFALLWGYCDDYGRGVDEPRLIKADCFPLDDDITAATINDWLNLMTKTDTVIRYEVNGRRYLEIPDWDEHQRPQHPKQSNIPGSIDEDMSLSGDLSEPPDEFYDDIMSASRTPHENLTPEGYRRGTGEVGEEEQDNPSSPEAADAATDQQNDDDPEREEDPPQATAPTKPDKNDRQDVHDLCNLLADLMVGNGCKRPTITVKWLDDARLMIDRDGRDPTKAAALIHWCQKDPFWRTNIQSMPTFRAKYDQLRLKAVAAWEAQRDGYSRNGPPASKTDDAIADLRRRAQERAAATVTQMQIGAQA